ncbi:SRPBCC family protein [Gloeobacter morelensis]|uniref:SRPBCC family protein n=1 Tax=Gloeobacter morelensis MG652769 TaxID=2781736 RepID=A0ABY3PSR3_9CYAN|nr:SRPBCC family protein [Gloeobacter morelensis]UFP96649.1 SRPBCC family protein [Gloeobacter morelensis MG652769]
MAIGTSDTVAAHGNHRVSIDIAAPPELAYALWTQFENFPRYFRHILEVRTAPENRLVQHWKGKIFGIEQEWDAEISTLTPNRVIAWRSVKGFENSGSLTFEPRAGAGTQLTAQIGYDPPMGALGDIAEAVWVKNRFDEGLQEDLTRFKTYCEGIYARIAERTGKGESMEAALQAVLAGEEGMIAQDLPTCIEPAEYDMDHAPRGGVITTTELTNRLGWGEVAFTLLDVRPLEAYKAAHIQGANAAPIESLEEIVREITASMSGESNRSLIVYSESGDGLSAVAAQRLLALGYTSVLDYTDGFAAWRSAGQPVETQTMGQIQSKGLPEREEYIDRVIAAPTANDNPVVGSTAAGQEKVKPQAYGSPMGRVGENAALSEEEFLRRQQQRDEDSAKTDPR